MSSSSSSPRLPAKEFEIQIETLLSDPQYTNHPLRAALAEMVERYHNQSAQIERVASISDGFQSLLRERNESLAQRNERNLRQLQKIVRISDHYQRMLQDANDALKISATHDALTGLPNRRLMSERLEAQAALAARHNATFSVAVLDVDFFKNINDHFGHQTGDVALVGLAKILRANLRVSDTAARWGGEEFLLLFPETPAKGAGDVAERMRRSLESWALEAEGNRVKFTASFGIAQHENAESLQHTLGRADRALYRAKGSGRNRVVFFDEKLDARRPE